MVRIVYETVESCKSCLHNRCGMCYKLSRPIVDLCFELDCPLPALTDVEGFTRYVTKDKELRCHGNCRHWKRWDYNKHLKAEIGICTNSSFKRVCRADNAACEEYDEI